MNLTFRTVPIIETGLGKISVLPKVCSELNVKNPIIITDNGLFDLGFVDIIIENLKKNDVQACIFKDVLADPPESNIFDAVKIFHDFKADGVIGLGGGSSMDVAKAVSYFSMNNIPISDCYGLNKLSQNRFPLIQIPTTAGTGSELTQIAIFTLESNEKMGIVDPKLFADCAILDADLTLDLPKNITAYSGIDAMVHAIEAYTTKIKKNPISDSLAKKALALLGKNIRIVINEPRNRVARENMLLGSMLAGMAFSNAPCAGVHALAYPIGAQFHVPHGLSNSLVLTRVLDFNSIEAKNMYCEIAPDCLPELKGKKISIDAFILGLDELINDLKIPKCLRDVGIDHKDIPKLAEDAMKQQRLLINNPREIKITDAISIYESVL